MPGVGARSEQCAHLVPQRDVVEQRIAPDAEHMVWETDETDGREAVPAVDDRQPIEPDQSLEPGQPCEEQHLDEREVCTEEPRDPGEARHEFRLVVDIDDVAPVVPEPHDRHGVGCEQGEDEACRSSTMHSLSVPCRAVDSRPG